MQKERKKKGEIESDKELSNKVFSKMSNPDPVNIRSDLQLNGFM